MDELTYDDVHVNFTREEWALLNPSQKSLYKDVMLQIYRNLNAVGMKEVVMERKPLEILTVVKPLHITVILQGMKEFVMERTSMKAFSMVKPLYITAVSKCIK
ncbi:putative KRAB domain-containing protein ZNF788 [Mus musculus]|uniref:putative KRAB domain-containing protein ZNF788 n=1 Tax=Mus musculus TaxID=10090 RepID=UPI0003D76E30|nr:putative KRAB domain-containing protein ZNF788 [Mus musculus]|eukprot:XP_006534697.1 PREDICTED: zinc finger protein 302 isoform X2 [Mus musculus]